MPQQVPRAGANRMRTNESVNFKRNEGRTRCCEVLTFRKGDDTATVATNGSMHVVQRGHGAKELRTMAAAIAALEADGFTIVTDEQRGL